MSSPSKRRNRAKNRRSSGTFVAIPHDVLESASYYNLSSKAVKLLVDLACQLNFKGGLGSMNNGDLCAAYSLMEKKGWRSKNTLNRARSELELGGFIEVTQAGGRNKPTLYAVTWQAIDEIPRKPWITPTKTPSRKWSLRSSIDQARSPPLFISLTPKMNSAVFRIAPIDQKSYSIDPKIAPVKMILRDCVGAILGHLYRSTMYSLGSHWGQTNGSDQPAYRIWWGASRVFLA